MNINKYNAGENLKYLVECTVGAFTHSKYIKGKTIPGLDISLSTYKNAVNGISFSEKTASLVAKSFSDYLTEEAKKTGYITVESLSYSNETFRKKYPFNAFKTIDNKLSEIQTGLYTNKLFRCYYLHPNCPRNACLGYFKLFEKNGTYKAIMVNDVTNPKDDQMVQFWFKDPDSIEKDIEIHKGLHMYTAITDESKHRHDISVTKNRIKIDFKSTENEPCYFTMFWNISITNSIHSFSYYKGGSALIVDTNDGLRGKNISAYKIGMETIEDLPDNILNNVKENPFNLTNKYLINELSIESNNGHLTIDNSDDNRWFRFLDNHQFRLKKENPYSDINVDQLISSLIEIKKEYEDGLEMIRKIINDKS